MRDWNVYLKGKLLDTVKMPNHFTAKSVRHRLHAEYEVSSEITVKLASKDELTVEKGHSSVDVLLSQVTTRTIELVTSPMIPNEVGGCWTAGHATLGAGMMIISEVGLKAVIEAARKEGAAEYADALKAQAEAASK